MADGVRRRLASLIVMTASGFAGLGYQIVWTRQCAAWLGHESAAVLAVVSAFFGGLAGGAWILGSLAEKSARPARWYAGCELVIALWGVLLAVVIEPYGGFVLRLTGVQPSPAWQWSVAFLSTFVLLLPATAAMGATLPAMERIVAALRGHGRAVAELYAANTLGAVMGALATTFVLIPGAGLARTTVLCSALNLACGVAALSVFATVGERAPEAAPPAAAADGIALRLLLTGLLGIGYEVLVVRVLGQVTESTVYTFAMLLAVYLVGTAAGAAAYQRWGVAAERGAPLGDTLVAVLSAACVGGTVSLWKADALVEGGRRIFGGGAAGAILAEAVPAIFAFGPATLAMGALFSHLCRLSAGSGLGFGSALALNTLGAAAAPSLCGVLLAPALGPKGALLLVSAAYLALVARRSWRRPVVWSTAAIAAGLGWLGPPLAFVDVSGGGRVVHYEDGVLAAVSVVEDAGGVARLRIDNRAQEGSSATRRVDGRQAWLPLLLHAAPRRALFLGLGTGITASSAAEDPALRVDAVELLPEVVAASALFTKALPGGTAARLHTIVADARRFVRASPERYDVIVSDNFHPARSGAASLYTVEHFQAVGERLAPGGVFCQWLPLHQLDIETLRSIAKSFLSAHPRGWGMLASNSLVTPVLGLVARREAAGFDRDAVRRRVASAGLPGGAAAMGLEDDLAVLGSFFAGPASLARFASSATANTDDRPMVAYSAPFLTYAPGSSSADRLLGLLRELTIQPEELLSPAGDEEWARRLSAYWTARDRFVESGRGVRPVPGVQHMLAQVREPLLGVLRISPDFRPAYDPLVSMATALARTDLPGAHALLTELTQIQPRRDEAAHALARLGARDDAPP